MSKTPKKSSAAHKWGAGMYVPGEMRGPINKYCAVCGELKTNTVRDLAPCQGKAPAKG